MRRSSWPERCGYSTRRYGVRYGRGEEYGRMGCSSQESTVEKEYGSLSTLIGGERLKASLCPSVVGTQFPMPIFK